MPKGETMPRRCGRHKAGLAVNAAEIFEMTEEDIIGFDALYESMCKCRKGVTWKDSAAHYVLNGIRETLKLERQLKTGTYRQRDPMRFWITSPKPRLAISISFRDRVYQRSLNDEAVYPQMTRHFIYDNAACQTGKGTDFARNRVKQFLMEHYRKHGTEGYILLGDVHGYYDAMRHDDAEAVLQRYLDEAIYKRCVQVLQNQYAGDTGYNPGSQMVQIIGISMLNDLDHYIKESLHMHFYVRYMDDSFMIHENRGYLEHCRDEIGEKLAEVGLEFNKKKTRIIRVTDGFLFMGFLFRLTETGKVIMTRNPERVKQERRKLRRMAAKYHRGEMTREKVYESYAGWKQFASRGNNTRLIMRMDKYLKELMEDKNDPEEANKKHQRPET